MVGTFGGSCVPLRARGGAGSPPVSREKTAGRRMHGHVFKKVYAGAPGLMRPMAANGKPAIFISHGRRDATMPIDVTSRRFVPRLKDLGYGVTYKEHDGGHQLPPDILSEVIEWFNAALP
jgi:predicted esterase